MPLNGTVILWNSSLHTERSFLGYVHAAPFSFLSVFVDENAARTLPRLQINAL